MKAVLHAMLLGGWLAPGALAAADGKVPLAGDTAKAREVWKTRR